MIPARDLYRLIDHIFGDSYRRDPATYQYYAKEGFSFDGVSLDVQDEAVVARIAAGERYEGQERGGFADYGCQETITLVEGHDVLTVRCGLGPAHDGRHERDFNGAALRW